MTPRSPWARLRHWLSCLTSIIHSQSTQITAEDVGQVISWAVSENHLSVCYLVITPRESSKDSLPTLRFARAWWEYNENNPQGLSLFLEGKEGIDGLSLVEVVSVFFTYFSFICYLFFLSTFFYLQRYFTPVQHGVWLSWKIIILFTFLSLY